MSIRNIQHLLVLVALSLAGVAMGELTADPTLRLTTEERFDDDPILRDQNNGQGQLMTKVSPQVGIDLKDRNTTVKSWYALDVLYRPNAVDNTFDQQTSFNHRGELDLKQALSNRLLVEGTFKIWKVTDPTALPRLGMARTFAPVFYGVAQLDGKYQLSERWATKIGYKFEGARIYEQPAHGGIAHTPYVDLWYALSRRSEIGLQYRFQYFAFETDTATASGVFGLFHHRITELLYIDVRAGPAVLSAGRCANAGVNSCPQSGVVPVVNAQLHQGLSRLELELEAGHDLVGASGFTSALWADFAALTAEYRLMERLKAFAAASYFRNGQAANVGLNPLQSVGPGQLQPANGYAFGAGVEWGLSKVFALQGAFDRIEQLGAQPGAGAPNVSRNIVAARLIITAL